MDQCLPGPAGRGDGTDDHGISVQSDENDNRISDDNHIALFEITELHILREQAL